LVVALGAISASVIVDGAAAGSANAGRESTHHDVVARGNRCPRSAILVPSCGRLWGLYQPPRPTAGQPWWSAGYPAVEHAIGRRLDIVKGYAGWQRHSFPTPSERHLARHRRVLYISWNAVNYKTRQPISYASIANGSWDSSIIEPEARALKHFHHRLFIDFDHEFDSPVQAGKGSPEQYVAAYRHIHEVFQRMHVHNVIWSWVSTGYVGNASVIRAAYPGARYVDWIGYDPYNFAGCASQAWESPHKTMGAFYRWTSHQPGMSHKPLLLSEYGSTFGPRVQQWYASLPRALSRLPRIRAVIQFSGAPIGACNFAVGDSAAAFAGFKAAANNPAVTGS
jgi:hypothetical protein